MNDRSDTSREQVEDSQTERENRARPDFLPAERMRAMRERWSEVQSEFVDDPRTAVEDAHKLVTELVRELTETFSSERSALEDRWSGGGDADTETLRMALQRYRDFFNRLLH